MAATEWQAEQQLQQAVAAAAIAVAQAAVAGAARIHVADADVEVDLLAHRVGTLLGQRLHAVSPTTIELVDPADAETVTDSPPGSTTRTRRPERSRRAAAELAQSSMVRAATRAG